jgi:hypothetical protein
MQEDSALKYGPQLVPALKVAAAELVPYAGFVVVGSLLAISFAFEGAEGEMPVWYWFLTAFAVLALIAGYFLAGLGWLAAGYTRFALWYLFGRAATIVLCGLVALSSMGRGLDGEEPSMFESPAALLLVATFLSPAISAGVLFFVRLLADPPAAPRRPSYSAWH